MERMIFWNDNTTTSRTNGGWRRKPVKWDDAYRWMVVKCPPYIARYNETKPWIVRIRGCNMSLWSRKRKYSPPQEGSGELASLPLSPDSVKRWEQTEPRLPIFEISNIRRLGVSRKTENTGFICVHCSAEVNPLTNGSYRNHCPYCLYSVHIDDCPSLTENASVGRSVPSFSQNS